MAPKKGYYGNQPVKEAEGMGGLVRVPHAMQPPAADPCKACPLRKDATPCYLGGYTPQMYITAMHSPASIACHASKGFHTGDISKQKHCTGVAAFRANIGMTFDPKFASVLQSIATVGKDDRFFETIADFVRHHTNPEDYA